MQERQGHDGNRRDPKRSSAGLEPRQLAQYPFHRAEGCYDTTTRKGSMQTRADVQHAVVHLRSYPRDQARHAHSFHQMVLPLAGTLELEIEGRGGCVTGNQAVFVPAGDRHAFAGFGENQFVVLDVPHRLVEALGAGPWLDAKRRGYFFMAPRLAIRLASLLGDDADIDVHAAAATHAWATIMLQAAISCTEHLPHPVDAALRYIDARALGTIQVADIANAAGVSCGHLHALFRDHIGRTPRQEVLRRRLRAAQAFLSDPRRPISEIALACGFADQASFTRAVRRVLGTTPGQLRRRAVYPNS